MNMSVETDYLGAEIGNIQLDFPSMSAHLNPAALVINSASSSYGTHLMSLGAPTNNNANNSNISNGSTSTGDNLTFMSTTPNNNNPHKLSPYTVSGLSPNQQMCGSTMSTSSCSHTSHPSSVPISPSHLSSLLPVIGTKTPTTTAGIVTDDTNLSSKPTALLQMALSNNTNTNNTNLDSPGPGGEFATSNNMLQEGDMNIKRAHNEFAWIKEKKSSRKHNQGKCDLKVRVF